MTRVDVQLGACVSMRDLREDSYSETREFKSLDGDITKSDVDSSLHKTL